MPDQEIEMCAENETEEPGMLQIVMLMLSVYVLIVFAVQTLVPLSEETNTILDEIDFVVCMFFLWDFCFRLWKAPSKLEYMKWGWIDLISSIPVLILPYSNNIRILRIVRLVRILRAFRSTKILAHYLYKHRARTGLVSVILMSFLVAIFAAIAELNLETSPDSNIKTSEDALWWAFSTITTVSCEKYPVTEGGRVVALFLMAAGVCLFGCITAYIATVFLEPLQLDEESEIKQVLVEMKLLREKVEALETSNQRLLSDRNHLPADPLR